jgi:hypothetical protein
MIKPPPPVDLLEIATLQLKACEAAVEQSVALPTGQWHGPWKAAVIQLYAAQHDLANVQAYGRELARYIF